jgi:hypothetical protein
LLIYLRYTQECEEWIEDYLYGMQNEMYRVPLDPENYAGYSYMVIAN